MKILITGSQGYIGTVLSEHLSNAGHEVLGFDTGFFKNGLLYEAFQTKTIWMDSRNITEKDLEGYDCLVHLSGISNDPMGKLKAETVYDPTREYTFKIAKMCKEVGIKFVFASSCSVYGIGDEFQLDEDAPTNPQTHYSLNKKQIEDDLMTLSGDGFSPIALRFATVFGLSPRIRFDIVVNMLTGMAVTDKTIILNSDGKAWRPNVHIKDVCEAIKQAVEVSYESEELLVLNVGHPENNMKIIDIAKTIQSVVSGCEIKFLSEDPSLDKEGLIGDRKVKNGANDTRTYQVSFERIKNILPSYEPQWSIKRGVEEMINQFDEISLSREKFKQREFYRLQQLEFLYNQREISEDLYWL